MLLLLPALWAASLLVEATVLLRRHPRVFTTFVLVDLARSSLMFAVWLWGTRNQYGFWFLITEPFDMILLCAAGIECFGRLVRERPPVAAYVAIISAVLMVGFVLPSVSGVPMTRMFTQRALMAFVPLALMIAAGVWHSRWPDYHGAVFALFCLFDLVTYLSLALYPEWARSRPLDAPLFVMCGQLGCLIAWSVRRL